MTRLNELYTESIRPQLLQQNGYKNILEVPKLQKIVINMGLGEAVQDSKKVASAVADLSNITGQKPVITRASKSVADLSCGRNADWLQGNFAARQDVRIS